MSSSIPSIRFVNILLWTTGVLNRSGSPSPLSTKQESPKSISTLQGTFFWPGKCAKTGSPSSNSVFGNGPALSFKIESCTLISKLS